jgi:hypothetical protein
MTHIDKNSIKHFSVCFILSLIGAYGMCVAVGASITREYDNSKTKGNHWCWWDIIFDSLGCVAGMTTHLWIFKSWNY